MPHAEDTGYGDFASIWIAVLPALMAFISKARAFIADAFICVTCWQEFQHRLKIRNAECCMAVAEQLLKLHSELANELNARGLKGRKSKVLIKKMQAELEVVTASVVSLLQYH